MTGEGESMPVDLKNFQPRALREHDTITLGSFVVGCSSFDRRVKRKRGGGCCVVALQMWECVACFRSVKLLLVAVVAIRAHSILFLDRR